MAGGGISVLSIWKSVDLLWSIPGRIDDLEVWGKWIKKISGADAVFPIGAIVGILLFTPEWWWPHFARLFKRNKEEVVASNSATVTDDPQVKRFSRLEPLITRHRKAVTPERGLVPRHLYDVWYTIGFRADREELIAELDALNISHPAPDAGRAVWYNYLVRLGAKCEMGNLVDARETTL